MNKTRLLVVFFFLALLAAFFAFDLQQYFSLAYFQSKRLEFQALYEGDRLGTLLKFFALYVGVAASSLPGATVLTLVAGALFGLPVALGVVSLASTVGAACALLISRFVLREWVQKRFGDRLTGVNEGIRREGAFYLLSLRLIPVFPFFIVNLIMGLTPIRTITFAWVSQLGMLPATAAYVNAGTQLGHLDSVQGLVSPALLLSFAALGVLPFVLKSLLTWLRSRRGLGRFKRPKKFDYNLVVIGGGSAGLVSSYIAAATRAKVALIEKNRLGGDCLNTGCIPSKALIRSARLAHELRNADALGMRVKGGEVDFAAVMKRVHRVIARVAPHDSPERYRKLGVECVRGDAQIVSPWEVKVGNRKLTTRAIVVASGAEPLVPPLPGLDKVQWLTSETLWKLRELPKRLLVLGGGPIGVELAQAFARLGSDVTIVEMANRLLPREDVEVSEFVRARLEAEKIRVLTGRRAVEAGAVAGASYLICEADGTRKRVVFDQLLIALGRKPRVKGFGLEEVGVELTDNGAIRVDENLRSSVPTIFACGDVAGPYQFTHVAAHQAYYASANALFGALKTQAVDYRVIPWVTFTDPEVARVGLSEQEAKERGVEVDVTRYDLEESDRAITEGENHGFVKVLTARGTDRIVGAVVVGHHGGELLGELVLAMKYGLGLKKILGTIHSYPTWVESVKAVAGEWRRASAPQGALRLMEKFHVWRRG